MFDLGQIVDIFMLLAPKVLLASEISIPTQSYLPTYSLQCNIRLWRRFLDIFLKVKIPKKNIYVFLHTFSFAPYCPIYLLSKGFSIWLNCRQHAIEVTKFTPSDLPKWSAEKLGRLGSDKAAVRGTNRKSSSSSSRSGTNEVGPGADRGGIQS